MFASRAAARGHALFSSSPFKRLCVNLPSAAQLHTSSPAQAESARGKTSRIVRQRNIKQKETRKTATQTNRPHVVLGTRPGDDVKWESCDLRKAIIVAEDLKLVDIETTDGAFPSDDGLQASGVTYVPPEQSKYLNYGLDGAGDPALRQENVEIFFDALHSADLEHKIYISISNKAASESPSVLPTPTEASGASMTHRLQAKREPPRGSPRTAKEYLPPKNAAAPPSPMTLKATQEAIQLDSVRQLTTFTRMVDLRNANARGLAFENRRRIIAAFSTPEQPEDPGRPEVQVALLTMKIRNLWEHLMRCKRDIMNRRSLRFLVHERAKLLKYLKRKDRNRYDRLLERIGVEPEAVEGELLV